MSRKTIESLTKRVLRIDSNEHFARQPKDLEQRAKDVITHIYIEEEPTVRQWARQLVPTKQGVANYARSLFPFAGWIRRYNLRWMAGDAIASLTIGFVVVPQAMAYAILANLSPEYGLYTSFVGAALYWLFGTSKDIVVGTTAVGSLLVGRVIVHVNDKKPGVYTHEEIAKSLSMIAGVILIFLGLFRLGWIIEFIPYVSISAFVTAASITIISTQLPVVLGVQGINTREAPYLVLISTFKALGKIKRDAAIGLTSIVLLFVVQDLCARMEVRQPSRKRMWATISSFRLTFTILLYTFISWLVHRNTPDGEYKFRIVRRIESGFKDVGFPDFDTELLGLIVPELPAIVIILIVEHIAIAKSFGRLFDYSINPSQEILAQGVANLFGPFMGGYVCTGSFGASAVLSKAGVRTPLAGLFSSMVLVIALYALTAVFEYIPMAALAGLIIHATSNLITPPHALYKYWQLSPFELFIWIAGVILALFLSLETSIYATIGLSFALLLVRFARTKGRFLGQVRIHQVSYDDTQNKTLDSDGILGSALEKPVDFSSSTDREVGLLSRYAFLPLDRKDGSNPDIEVNSPYPGVVIYRFSEGFNYINQALHINNLFSYILKVTRRTKASDGIKATDRLWNDPGSSLSQRQADDTRPFLRAVVLDCAGLSNIDITSIQGMIDLRNTLDKYAAPVMVDWHFAGILNRWTRRTLAVAGFGYPSADNPDELGNWSPAYTVASSLAGATDTDTRRAAAFNSHDEEKDSPHDNDSKKGEISSASMIKRSETHAQTQPSGSGDDATAARHERVVPVYGVNKPFFHIDLTDAVDAAVRDARRKDQGPAN